MTELVWKDSEKKAARRAYEIAVKAEIADVIEQVKARAAALADMDGVAELQGYIAERRRNIDRTYDYRYSQLIVVFARLILDGRLTLEHLDGLDHEKRQKIASLVEFAKGDAP